MEKCIEVDEKDNEIGVLPIAEFFDSRHIHRSSHLLLFNSKEELLLQKRSHKKKLFPGVYDFSVGGFVSEGESYEETLVRETKEELGISAPYRKLFKYKFFDSFDKSWKMVYSAVYDGKITRQKSELDSVRWLPVPDLMKEMDRHPEHFNPSFIEGIKIFLDKFK